MTKEETEQVQLAIFHLLDTVDDQGCEKAIDILTSLVPRPDWMDERLQEAENDRISQEE